jgi:hypothetical protein
MKTDPPYLVFHDGFDTTNHETLPLTDTRHACVPKRTPACRHGHSHDIF